jgi:molybdopterin synthase sulfur carrier subunit
VTPAPVQATSRGTMGATGWDGAREAQMVRVRYFAAAAQAAGVQGEELAADTLGELRAAMVRAHGPDLARVLSRCSVLVAGRRLEDPAAPLADGDLADVLPPFAGG